MYTLDQYRCIARELARTGGIVTQAARNLRQDYDSFPRISSPTVRRIMKLDVFQEILKEQDELLVKAAPEGELEAEKRRAREETTGKRQARAIAKMVSRGLTGLREAKKETCVLKLPKEDTELLLRYLHFLAKE